MSAHNTAIVVSTYAMLMDTDFDDNQMDFAQTAHTSGKDMFNFFNKKKICTKEEMVYALKFLLEVRTGNKIGFLIEL
ncbi:hypothetical protein MTR_6g070930 [Medicago truncatula]|uniref:Uncharacterized protein n=1 Tax=Medicago truncatula TaxID=3880 RepID=G7KQ96_MEDTR|nr:hypothetical protein MTR_6g070930 [Medicago truncatula]